MKLLWLDDCRNPAYHTEFDGEIIWVKSFDEFNKYLEENGLPDKISFDYSLNDMNYDGISCVKSVICYCEINDLPFPRFSIHSEHPNVYKLRGYINNSIELYELGNATEEDRKPDTEDQMKVNKQIEINLINHYDGFTTYENPFKNVTSKTKGVTIVKGSKIGRNEPCSCGSGKKSKKCCK